MTFTICNVDRCCYTNDSAFYYYFSLVNFSVIFFITLIQFFNSVTEENEDIDENDKTMRGMKLNSEAWLLSYCSGGVFFPELEFRNCAFCKHSMIDEPYYNQSVIEENDKMINEYKEKLCVLNLYKEGKGPSLKTNCQSYC